MPLKQFKCFTSLFLSLSIFILFLGCGRHESTPPVLWSHANLSALTISNGVLNPSFDSATVAYTSMFIAQSSVTLTPTAENAGATIRVDGTIVTSGEASSAITLNPGATDWFGNSVSLSGDTLAVGGYYESSNATGVNGDQTDNSAANSGAVYILR